ncbi:hypothetical protein [Spirosoma arcticum]
MNDVQITSKLYVDDKTFKAFKEKSELLMKLSIIQAINAKNDNNVFKYNFSKLEFPAAAFRNHPNYINDYAARISKINTVVSVGEVFSNYFEKLSKSKKEAVVKKVTSQEVFTTEIRNYLVTNSIDLKKTDSVLNQLDVVSNFAFINDATVNQVTVDRILSNFGWIHPPSLRHPPLNPVPSPNKIKELRFRLHQVKCIDETDPEWGGNDKIGMGGVSINDKGELRKISEFRVGNDFRDGIVKDYLPNPNILRKFPLDDDYAKPKHFFVNLFMAEIDNGGFGAFLNDAYEAIRNELQVVLSALGAAAGAFIGAEIGGTLGTAIGGPIGTVIGILAGIILGALVAWIVSLSQDDVFTPLDEHQSIIVIPDATSDFGGSDTTPVQSMFFRDHGGTYRVNYSWALVR